MIYSREDLRTIFQSQFNSEAWIGLLVNLFGANHLLTKPDRLDSSTGDETGWYLGEFTTADHYRIGLFRFDIKNSSVSKRKIGLRNLVKPYLKYDFDCAIVAFVEGGSSRWRFSFHPVQRNTKSRLSCMLRSVSSWKSWNTIPMLRRSFCNLRLLMFDISYSSII